MSKAYRITYKINGDDYIEYYRIQKEENMRYVGVSAQNSFYDEIVFDFDAPKSKHSLKGLIEEGIAVEITEEEFTDGFNGMLKKVKEKCKKANGNRK